MYSLFFLNEAYLEFHNFFQTQSWNITGPTAELMEAVK